jgi:hypothetical protein
LSPTAPAKKSADGFAILSADHPSARERAPPLGLRPSPPYRWLYRLFFAGAAGEKVGGWAVPRTAGPFIGLRPYPDTFDFVGASPASPF